MAGICPIVDLKRCLRQRQEWPNSSHILLTSTTSLLDTQPFPHTSPH